MGKLEELVEKLKNEKAITDKRIEKAFLSVPREKFFPVEAIDKAFLDIAYSIGEGASISQPTTIAIMLHLLNLKKEEKVLEVGSGSGYVLALIHNITKEKVYGLEIDKHLATKSKKTLENLGIPAKIIIGNVKSGIEGKYDKILLSVAVSKVPDGLFDCLKESGLIVAPVGEETQDIIVYTKNKKPIFRLGSFAFVKIK